MKHRLLPVPFLVVALDQWSKWLIEHQLAPYASIAVIPGFFDITHVTNTGIAFGLFPSRGNVAGTVALVVLGLAALAVIALYFWRAAAGQTLLHCALALIMGGAVGNLIDRILLHAVTDFFDVYIGTHHWPTFNVADSAISVGIGLLALETLKASPAERTAAREGDSRSENELPRAVAGES